ncbi:unnamed protein product [Vitrella brassicaformis CCMP3155]|uniref:EGF-like domain-containing protein n=2 Tax=Vitrella brassicaformis TaxID=1169539 RepID=A0A0G4GQP6_VITBC|nr:unnamed protein product [Vitrella brassicaformis CCMP3155]|eukprot:CEM32782.1 unnamed protein product [Vitrella brassicaformis CCMP3155]
MAPLRMRRRPFHPSPDRPCSSPLPADAASSQTREVDESPPMRSHPTIPSATSRKSSPGHPWRYSHPLLPVLTLLLCLHCGAVTSSIDWRRREAADGSDFDHEYGYGYRVEPASAHPYRDYDASTGGWGDEGRMQQQQQQRQQQQQTEGGGEGGGRPSVVVLKMLKPVVLSAPANTALSTIRRHTTHAHHTQQDEQQPAPTSTSAAAGGDKASAVEDPHQCSPPCVEGRGICEDSQCFCRHPYTGVSCQLTVDSQSKIGFSLTIGLFCVAVFLGMVIAVCCTEFLRTVMRKDSFTTQTTLQAEVWRTSGRRRR